MRRELALLTGRRTQAVAKIDAHIATLSKDMAAANGEAGLRSACIKPLETLREQVQNGRKPRSHHAGRGRSGQGIRCRRRRIEDFVRKLAEQKRPKDDGSGDVLRPSPVVKKQRIVKPAES